MSLSREQFAPFFYHCFCIEGFYKQGFYIQAIKIRATILIHRSKNFAGGSMNDKQLVALEAVSYTHLDVYKRQAHMFSDKC